MDAPTLAGNLGLTLRHGHQCRALETNVGRTVAVEIVHGVEIALHHLHPVEIDPIVLLLKLRLILFRGRLRCRVWLLAEKRCCSQSTSPNPPNSSSKHYNGRKLPVTIHSTFSLQNFAKVQLVA